MDLTCSLLTDSVKPQQEDFFMPPLKQIQRSPVDTYKQIAQTAQINTWAFAELEEKKDYAAVRLFRDRIEQLFQQFDARMCNLCGDDTNELTLWGARMRIVRDMLDTLDRSLAFVGKRQFNWDQVLAAMGLLSALQVATEQTLYLND
jgi:hypothetical protein